MSIRVKGTYHSVNHDEARSLINKAPKGCRFYLWARIPGKYLGKGEIPDGMAVSVKISRAAALELVSETIGPDRQKRSVLINITTYAEDGQAMEALYVG